MTQTHSSFAIGEHDFLLDGEPFQIISGALHYFRVHPGQWADRIRKAKQMGLNTIETYVAWNAHAPREGDFDLGGGLDLGAFLDLVAAEGMHAIVRPGPYICAEWANGGLPAWLWHEGVARVRCNEPHYLAAVERYFEQLAPVLVPRQIDRGGPIILMQVENEYGAYGSDKDYLRALVELYHRVGVTVPLTTVDQPVERMLEDGSLPELHRTGSFGSRVRERLDTLRRHQPTGPLMCSEFWDGWFDSWGQFHHTTPVEQTAADLEELLARGASVNIYMFHGGTNFGFGNGANDKGVYQPIVTSYDYDAPLDEAGQPTAKYWAMREVIARHAPVPADVPQSQGPAPQPHTAFTSGAPLSTVLELLGDASEAAEPVSSDSLDRYDGFTLYRTTVELSRPAVLSVDEVRDRAQVFVDGAPVGVLSRETGAAALTLPAAGASAVIELLVEDQGRVNYGPRIGEPKGLIGGVALDGRPVRGWSVRPLELARIRDVEQALTTLAPDAALTGPAFFSGAFEASSSTDLFLDTSAWGKGVAWVNGFCLGRYWSRAPQRTLYVPAPIVRVGENTVTVLELEALAASRVPFAAALELGPVEW